MTPKKSVVKIQNTEDIISCHEVSMGLLDILKNGGGYKDLLEYGSIQIGNPVLLVDMSYNYLDSAGIENMDDEPVWEYTIKNGFMPNYFLKNIAKEEKSEEICVYELRKEKISHINHRQIHIRIAEKDKVLGYLYIMENKEPVSNVHIRMAEILSDYLAICMSASTGGENFRFSVIENFLTSILRNKITNAEEIKTRQELFGIKLYDVLHVITIEINDFRASEEKKNYILNKVKRFFDRSNVIVLNTYIVVLYDTRTKEEAFSEKMMSEFSSLMESNNCRANISFAFRRLTDFYRFYIQTVDCIKMREILGNTDSVLSYKDVIDYHMLFCFAEQVDMDLLINEAVTELIKIDRDNDSNYIETLFIYVNCQQNLAKAAEKMSLHYNTLKYRINRIIALTGIDLADKDTVFSIMVSEKILMMKELMANSGLNYFDLVGV